MGSFRAWFEELANAETRAAVVRGRPELPDGDYGFCEFYCLEATCDCRQVLLLVHRDGCDKTWASISYGWEPPSFYAAWAHCSLVEAGAICRPTLDRCNPQTACSFALLEIFRTVVLDDVYVRRLRRHYALFKRATRFRRLDRQ